MLYLSFSVMRIDGWSIFPWAGYISFGRSDIYMRDCKLIAKFSLCVRGRFLCFFLRQGFNSIKKKRRYYDLSCGIFFFYTYYSVFNPSAVSILSKKKALFFSISKSPTTPTPFKSKSSSPPPPPRLSFFFSNPFSKTLVQSPNHQVSWSSLFSHLYRKGVSSPHSPFYI